MTGAAAQLAAAEYWRDIDPPKLRHLRLVGERERSVLPRWQRRSAWTPLAEDGAYSRVPAWQSRPHFLEVVVPFVIEIRPDVLAAHHVSPDTFRRWVWAESMFADYWTGRRIIRRPRTVGLVAEMHERTVQRCRAAARELGIYVDVVKGRMLTLGEVLHARFSGSPQRGLANESAFQVPKWVRRHLQPVESVDNSKGHLRLVVDSATPSSGVARRASQLTGSCGSLTGQGKKEPTSSAQRHERVDSPGFKLALAVRKALPWARREAPGRLSRLLERYASSPYRWTAQDVVQHLDAVNRARRRRPVDPDDVDCPFGLLAWYFRDDERRPLDPVEHHPRLGEFLWIERRNAAARLHRELAEDQAARRAQKERGGCGSPGGCPVC
ncbi:hypothetical protein ACQHIV_42170 (plasmid) [Kribbella sp. GL6]|uniref:hypothetical protein n=1 Tax=Kribbella sp. GL6 TaxID=3419765 RepID=UPI003CFD263B